MPTRAEDFLRIDDDLGARTPGAARRVDRAMASVPAGSMIGKLCVDGRKHRHRQGDRAGVRARGARVVPRAATDRAAVAARDIIDDTGNRDVECRLLDLAEFASVRAFAEGFEGPRAEVHVSSTTPARCSARRAPRRPSERQVNCVSPHLSPDWRCPLRRAAAASGDVPGAARLVYVGSKLERSGDAAAAARGDHACSPSPPPVPGLVPETSSSASLLPKKFDTFGAYATVKQCATALTFELARRHGHPGVSVHACTPGMVNTSLGRFAGLAPPAWPAVC